MSRSAPLVVATICVLARAVAPAGAAPSAPTPALAGALKEIGRVHARTAFCREVLESASSATQIALANDASFDETARFLGRVSLDDDKLAKPNAIVRLQRDYAAIETSAQSAIETAKQLRELAPTAPSPAQSEALVAYANAIGGALHRQQGVAAYFRRFAMYLETHDQVAWQQHDEDLFYAARTPAGPFDHGGNPHDRVAPTLTEVARSESVQIGERRASEISDEVRAAGSLAPAFDPCTDTTPEAPSPAP